MKKIIHPLLRMRAPLTVVLGALLLAGCQCCKDKPAGNSSARTTPAPPTAVESTPVTQTASVAAAEPKAAAKPAPAATATAPKTIRIKAGSSNSFTDASGNVWLPDQGFADGETIGREDDMKIENTADPALYRTERYGMTSFSFPLSNGKYTVKLHFAETYEEISGAGQRVFSFNVEGKEIKDFDVFVKAGGARRAHIETVTVEVADGKLDITFTSNIQNPLINGIEIVPAS